MTLGKWIVAIVKHAFDNIWPGERNVSCWFSLTCMTQWRLHSWLRLEVFIKEWIWFFADLDIDIRWDRWDILWKRIIDQESNWFKKESRSTENWKVQWPKKYHFLGKKIMTIMEKLAKVWEVDADTSRSCGSYSDQGLTALLIF